MRREFLILDQPKARFLLCPLGKDRPNRLPHAAEEGRTDFHLFCQNTPVPPTLRQSYLAVDLKTGAVVAVTVQPADTGDTQTVKETLITAAENVEKVKPKSAVVQELVADKGYHSNDLLKDLTVLGVRTYISEPARGRRNWKGKHAAREAVYGNRRRIGGTRGRRLLRQRGERLERPFAHAYETGRLRRVYLRGHSNILKRVLIHIAALNLGLLMRLFVGVGTPRGLQGRRWSALARLVNLWRRLMKVYLPVLCASATHEPTVIGTRVVVCP